MTPQETAPPQRVNVPPTVKCRVCQAMSEIDPCQLCRDEMQEWHAYLEHLAAERAHYSQE